MSVEKKQENNFKFGLYLRGEKIFERIFSADLYNPVVRYSVDIRNRIPSIIENIQHVLQSTNLNFTTSFKNEDGNSVNYNTKNYYKHICTINKMAPIKMFVPTNYSKDRDAQQKPKYPSKGTEFKFGVYINSHPIVERNFYVDNYNPSARFSNELPKVLNDIVDYLTSYLKKSDVNHMWNDYDLIMAYELNIQQVRELSSTDRVLKQFAKTEPSVLELYRNDRDLYLGKKSDLAFTERVRMENNRGSDYSLN
jgi:hypothetical protein